MSVGTDSTVVVNATNATNATNTTNTTVEEAAPVGPKNYIGVALPAQPYWMGMEQYYLYAYEYQLNYLKKYPATHPSQEYYYQQTLMTVEHELASWEHKAELMEAQFHMQQEISMAPYYEQEMLRYQYGMELATMYKEYVQAEVERVLTRMQSNRYTSKQNVTDMLSSAAEAVGCNSQCVGSCSNASWTIQEAGTCLDRCYCYT